MAELQDLLERMKREGQLLRNEGKNSLKQTNRILGEMNAELVEIGKSLGVIRTIGVGGLGGGVVQVGGGSVTAAAVTPAVPQQSEDPELGLGGLLKAAIRNQTLGRVERGADAAKEAALKKFQESFLGQGIARGREAIGERKESFAESLRGLAGLQTNAEKREIEEKQLAEQKATRDEIEKLVEVQTAFLGLSQKEADALRNAELRKRDLEAEGATPTAAMMGGAGGAGGGTGAGGGAGGGSGGGKMGGIIGKFFGGLGGGLLAGFVSALGNPLMLKSAGIFALVLPLIGVGLAGFVAAIGVGFAAAAAVVGKGLEVLNPALEELGYSLKPFEDINGDKLAAAGDGMADMLGGLVSIGIGGLISGLADTSKLNELADVMKKFNGVDGERLKLIGPAMQSIGGGLAALGGSGVIQGIAGLVGSDSPIQQFETLTVALKKFDGINTDHLIKVGPAVKSLGEGLSAMGSGGLKEAVGNIVGAFGSLFGVEEEDPVENIKKFATLGEGETGTSLIKAGNSLGALGGGMSELNKLDTGGISKLAEDIIPPLTDLGNAFNSEVFMFGDENPITSTLKAFEGLKELENINGKETKVKIEAIAEGLEDFAKTLDDGEIETLAQYVREVAGPILALTGRGGDGGGSGGSGAKGDGGAPRNEDFVPGTYEAMLEDARRTFEATGDRSAIENVQKDKRAGVFDENVQKDKRADVSDFDNSNMNAYERKKARIEAKKRLMRADPNTLIVRDGQVVQEGNLGLAPGQKFLTKEQYDRIITDPANETNNRLKDIATRNYLQGQQINAGSNDVASAQRREGAPTVVAPTNNNQSTTVNNVNNSSSGGGGGISARRPRQIRGGMYDAAL